MAETAWDDIQRLCADVGMETVWEHRMIEHPDLICEPLVEYAWDDEGTATTTCSVHCNEYWPCKAVREGRGVTPQPATLEPVFVVRPKETR